MPNNYTNTLMVFPGGDDDRDILQELTDAKWSDGLLHRVRPMPAELEGATYDWQITERGVKWDAYDALPPARVPGDAFAVQLTFCTAWSAPNPATCNAVVAELVERFGAGRVVWLGLNPSNDSFRVVGEWGSGATGCIEPTDSDHPATLHVLADHLEASGAPLSPDAMVALERCDPQHRRWFTFDRHEGYCRACGAEPVASRTRDGGLVVLYDCGAISAAREGHVLDVVIECTRPA